MSEITADLVIAYEEGAGKRRLMRPAKRIRKTKESYADAVKSAREDIAAIKTKSNRYLPAVITKQVAEREEQFRDEVAEIEATAKAELDQARSAASTPARPKDPGEAQLLEARKARAWSRLEKRLDAGQLPERVIRELGKEGDTLALEALKEELPSWLSAKERSGETKAMLEITDEVEGPLLPDERRDAREALQEAEKAAKTAEMNAEMIRSEGLDVMLVVGDEPKEFIDLGGEE